MQNTEHRHDCWTKKGNIHSQMGQYGCRLKEYTGISQELVSYKEEYTTSIRLIQLSLNCGIYWALLNNGIYWALLENGIYRALLDSGIYWALLDNRIYWALLDSGIYWALVNSGIYWALLWFFLIYIYILTYNNENPN